MPDDPLFKLLHGADSATVPTLGNDLVTSVYRRHRVRRFTRSTATVAVIVAIGFGATLFVPQLQPPPEQLVTTQPALPPAPDMQLMALDAELDLHTRTADLLLAGERRRQALEKSQRILEGEDALDEIDQQRNRAALTLISQADRMATNADRLSDAMEMYRRTIHLFPGTAAATVAAKRLEQLQT